jgi:hypothetical protein
MSFRRFNLFASNTSVITNRHSARSTRPPTYNSNTIAPPTYIVDVPRTAGARESARNIRPPTYTSDAIAVSTRRTNDHHERASTWTASLPSASRGASQDSETLFQSSLADTFSVGENLVEMTTLGSASPRYSELS